MKSNKEVPKSRFHITTKPCGSHCNLKCKYCYYLEKENLFKESKSKIPDDILEEFIKKYIESQPTNSVLFTWQGGEPALASLDFYEKVVELQKKYGKRRRIKNSFQTNGTLLDERWMKFFKDNDFYIGISLDGPEHLHDFYRKSCGGKGSFKDVMKSVEMLKKYGIRFNTLTTVNAKNVKHPEEVYEFLKNLGGELIQFLPIVERKANDENELLSLVNSNYEKPSELTEESVNPIEFGDFLIRIFDKWVKADVGKVFLQHFETALEAWTGNYPTLCTFSPICGAELVIEHNGDLYSCDHYVYPEHKVGNIMKDDLQEIMNGEKQLTFAVAKSKTLCTKCKHCKYVGACNGDCPKHRFVKTDGVQNYLAVESGYGNKISYLCEGLHKYFRHIDPYMEHMGREISLGKSPISVMKMK